MAATNADVIAVQLEKVNPKIQRWYEMSNQVTSMIEKASPSHKISTWSQTLSGGQTLQGFRIPVQQYIGGDFGTFDYNGGDLGRGSSQKDAYMTTGYYPTKLGFELTGLQKEATADSEQATVQVFADTMSKAMKAIGVYDDNGFMGAGNGIIATGVGSGSSGNTNPTYALEPNFGADRLVYNQPVDVFDAALANNKGVGLRVNTIDWVNKTVTLTGTVTGAGFVNTDVLAMSGMSAPLTTGSYKNGLYMFNNSATSGFTLALNRATVSEIVTPTIAAGGPLVPAQGLALKDQLIQRRDTTALAGMRGIWHMAQRAQAFLTGISISEWQRNGASQKMIDIMPSNTDLDQPVDWCGISHMLSKRQDRSRVDWINPKTWGRVYLHPAKFYEVGGTKIFEGRTSAGNVATYMNFFIVQAENYYQSDPGAAGFISGLTLPAGY